MFGFNVHLCRCSMPTFSMMLLAKSLPMKPCQVFRSLSFSTRISSQNFLSFRAKNLTIMTTRELEIENVERGQCAHTKRKLTTTVAAPPTPPKDSTTVSIEELKAMIAENDIQLIDVREPHELQETGKIPTSVNIPLADVPKAFAMKPTNFMEKYNIKKPEEKDANIVFHCKAGVRSHNALKQAQQLGFQRSRHFPGGFNEWVANLKRD